MTNNSGRFPNAVCSIPVALGPSRSPSASTERPTKDASVANTSADTMNASTAVMSWLLVIADLLTDPAYTSSNYY